MTTIQHSDLARRIEQAKRKSSRELTPRSQEAILWFLDFIDSAEPDEINAYIELLDDNQLLLIERNKVKRKQPPAEASAMFPTPTDEAVDADPLKRREPEPNSPGEQLQDYLG